MPSLTHKTKISTGSKAGALALSLSLITLSGCSYIEPYKAPMTQGNVMTSESVQLLQEGLTKRQVRELLGPPQGQHPFQPNHWEYVYFSTLKNEKNEALSRHLVIAFDDDQLLKSWKEQEHKVELKEDKSWLGLGWF